MINSHFCPCGAMEARETSNLKVAGSSPAMDFFIHIIDYRKLDPKHTRIHPLHTNLYS